jgi:hypothetical protein
MVIGFYAGSAEVAIKFDKNKHPQIYATALSKPKKNVKRKNQICLKHKRNNKPLNNLTSKCGKKKTQNIVVTSSSPCIAQTMDDNPPLELLGIPWPSDPGW